MLRRLARTGVVGLIGAAACAPAPAGAPPGVEVSPPLPAPAPPAAPAPAPAPILPDDDGYLGAWACSPALPGPADPLPPEPDPASPPAAWPGWGACLGGSVIDLGGLTSATDAVIYAAVDLVAPAAAPAVLHTGADDGLAAWLDGQRLPALDDPGPHAWAADAHAAPVTLHPGANRLVVRVRQAGGAWRFSVRVTDPAGAPLPGLTLSVPGADDPAHAEALGRALVAATQVTPAFTLTREGLTARVTVAAPAGLGALTRGLRASAGAADLPFGEPVPLPLATTGDAVVGTVTVDGPGGARRTVEVRRAARPAAAAVALDAADTLADLRRRTPALFTPEPAPQVGVWADTLGAPPPGAAPPGLDRVGVATLEWLAGSLRGAIEEGAPDEAWVAGLAKQVGDTLAAVRRGADPFAGRTGAMWMAYRSRLDGTAQPFALVVPRTFAPGRTWALHVGLHGLGSGPGRFIRELLGVPLGRGESDDAAERAFPTALTLPDPTDFVVAPFGRGDLAFRGPGEDDVLSVLDTVLRRYPIDRDRVDLTGVSMGGIGVFELATRRPDVFAHAQPLAGAADIREFSSLRGKAVTAPEAAVLKSVAAIEYAENLGNLPLDAVHGRRDTAIGDVHTARMMDKLAALGSPDKTFTRPNLGHGVQDATYAAGALWTTPLRPRVRFPPHVTFVSGDLRARSAYWVRVDAALAPDQFVRIDAHVDGGAVTVTTENVAAFSLLAAAAPGAVSVDGAVVAAGSPPAGPVRSFERRGGGFVAVAPADPPDPAGPLGANRSAPRLFTYGTGNPATTALNRAVAERLAAPAGIQGSALPVVADTAVGAAELDAYDLVAVGTPADHAVLAAAAAAPGGLPVAVDAAGLTFAGQRYPGADVGAAFALPNPLRPRHALLVYTGAPAALALTRCLPRYLPDFVVFDGRIRCLDAGNVLDGRPVLALGFFPPPARAP